MLKRVLIAFLILNLPPSCVPSIAADDHAAHHEEYKEWQRPDVGGSCCNEKDCRPVKAEIDLDGNWTAWVDGARVDIERSKILPNKAKDGRSHFCGIVYPQGGSVTFCFTAGDVRS